MMAWIMISKNLIHKIELHFGGKRVLRCMGILDILCNHCGSHNDVSSTVFESVEHGQDVEHGN